jgi:hypothetical protein
MMEKMLVHLRAWNGVLTAALALSASDGFAAVSAGKVASVSGKVLARIESQPKAPTRTLKPGDEIFSGDVLNTSNDGSLKILFSDQTIIDLGPSSLFKVDDYRLKSGSDRQVDLSVAYGRIRASVNQKVGDRGSFRVRTKTATMGVRGTEFLVLSDLSVFAPPSRADLVSASAVAAEPKAPPSKTQIVVLEGTVEVAAKSTAGGQPSSSVTLTEGKALTTSSSEAPVKIQTLSNTEITQAVKETKVADNTFKQAVVIDRSTDSKGSSGTQTLAALSGSFQLPAGFAPKPGDLGLPGTFGADVGFNQGYNPGQLIGAVPVRVIFTFAP